MNNKDNMFCFLSSAFGVICSVTCKVKSKLHKSTKKTLSNCLTAFIQAFLQIKDNSGQPRFSNT
jgi:hypothetical protein